MGRSEVYDCADVNDIIQILNQAARFQPSGSSPLAASLENLTWIPAAEQSYCCRQERTAQTGNDKSNCSGRWFVVSCLSVCPFARLLVHYFKSERVNLIVSNNI